MFYWDASLNCINFYFWYQSKHVYWMESVWFTLFMLFHHFCAFPLKYWVCACWQNPQIMSSGEMGDVTIALVHQNLMSLFVLYSHLYTTCAHDPKHISRFRNIPSLSVELSLCCQENGALSVKSEEKEERMIMDFNCLPYRTCCLQMRGRTRCWK